MSVKTNQSIVNQLVPTLSSDSIDGSGCTLLLDLPKEVYWKIVEVSAKEQKHPDEKTAEWLTEKIQKLIQAETPTVKKRGRPSKEKTNG